MKFEPRAIELVAIWCSRRDVKASEVLRLYKVAMKYTLSHEASIALVRAWAMAVSQGSKQTTEEMIHDYGKAIAIIEETDTEEFFNQEIAPILKAEGTPVQVAMAKTPPMMPELKSRNEFLDGNYRKNHPARA